MAVTYSREQRLVKLDELAKLAYSHHMSALRHQEAERNSISELLTFAVEQDIDRDDVKDALIKAGYKPQTAAVYASQVNSVQEDPEAREKMDRTGSFFKAVKRAARNRKEADPSLAGAILKNKYLDVARLAHKYELTLEQHLERS